MVIANRTDSNHNSHARVWASGAWTDIPPLGGGSATSNFNSATGLNNSGDVVGWSGLPPDSGGTVHFHGFLWHGGTLSDLGDSASATPATPDTRATAINDGGQIVGYGQGYTQSNGGASTSTRAIQWVNGHAATIGSFRADSQANGITAAGQILVYHLESDGGHVAVWSGGQATECVATHVVGWAMNNSDLVVGRIDASPVVWNAKSGNVQQIGPQSAGHYAEAMSVNTQGQVVGYWSESSEYAFIWSASGGFKDLNTVLPSNSGWVLQRAYGINDSDQVVGYGTFHGVSHAFLFQLAT